MKHTIYDLHTGKNHQLSITHQAKCMVKSFLIFLMMVLLSPTIQAEEGFIYKNQFFVVNNGYQIADYGVKDVSWTWNNRVLRFSNSFGTPNANAQYPACDEWILFGPFDLSTAQSPSFNFINKLEYGSNSLSVLASSNFTKLVTGASSISGDWTLLKDKADLKPTLNKDTTVRVDLSTLVGNKSVYVGIRYSSILTGAVSTSSISEMSITRNVNQYVREFLPTPELTTAKNNIDYYNLSTTIDKWSVRTGSVKASTGNNLWFVYRTFDLRSSSDAFFSIASLMNPASVAGPVGLKIMITPTAFKAGDMTKDFKWQEYPNFGIDHRTTTGVDYVNSKKMSLKAYLGGYVTIAFQYINANAVQYQLKDFKIYHIPDTIAPTFRQFAISRTAYNRTEVLVNATEAATMYWGIYPESYTGTPTVEQLKLGTGADVFGLSNYVSSFTDSLYVYKGLQADRKYKLFGMLEDLSSNKSVVSVLDVNTPPVDLTPPSIDTIAFSNITNTSFKAVLGFSEPCNYYYLIRPTDQGLVDSAYLVNNGKNLSYKSDLNTIDFGNLQKNVQYSLFVIATDFAGNVSPIMENKAFTASIDLDPPVIQSFDVASISNTGFTLGLKVTEISKIYYAVQSLEEVPPTADGIKSGGRAKVFGVENYTQPGNDFQFTVSGLKPGINYVLYFFAADTVNNISLTMKREIKTLSLQVPVLTRKSEQYIEIGREDTLSIDRTLFNVVGYDQPEQLDVLIYSGDNYRVFNQSIIANDEFTGTLSVPIAMGKDTIPLSNIINLNVIVDKKTVADSLVAVRNLMSSNNKLDALPDLSTSIALLNMKTDGDFFDAVSSLSPTYSSYMTKVLGGRMINIMIDYSRGIFRRRKEIEVRHKMYTALEYWLDHKPAYSVPESPFLWPKYMGAILLVLHDDMKKEYEELPEYRDQIDRIRTKASDFNDWCWNGAPEGKTFFQPFEGNNMSKRLWGTFAIAASLEQPLKALMVRDTLYKKLNVQYNDSVNQKAGIAPDGSYTMNNASGAQWNWGVFGADYINDIIEYASFTRRTPWRLTQDKFQVLGDALTDGAPWLFWKDFLPYNLAGRNSTRTTQVQTKGTYLNLFNNIRYESLVNNSLLDNNQQIADNFVSMTPLQHAFDSTKYFWNSNIMIHSRADFYSSLVMPSVRTGVPEASPDSLSGLKNWFMGDGTLLTMVDATSYATSRRVWNYFNLPGLTTEQRPLTSPMMNGTLPVNYGGFNGKSQNNFAGGLSNGREGVASFYYDRTVNVGNVIGQKSYFFFENGIVALGTGLKKKLTNNLYNVMSFVEQDVMSSDLKYDIGTGVVNTISSTTTTFTGSYTPTNSIWMYTGNKGYVFFPQSQGEKIDIQINQQTGSWDEINGTWRNYRINPAWIMPYTTSPVLTIDIDHGKQPTNAKYAYMIFPGLSEAYFTNNIVGKVPYTILANNDSVQAVSGSSTSFQIVFLKGCSVELSANLSVKVDKPAIMMVKVKPDGLVEALVSDPLQKSTMLNTLFTIKEENKAQLNVQRLVSFPQGVRKGEAVFTSTGDVWGVIPALVEENRIDYVKPSTVLPANKDEKQKKNTKESFNFKAYPLPLGGDRLLNLNYLIDQPGSVEISLTNALGQRVYHNSSQKESGSYYDQIDCKNIVSGLYLLEVKYGDRKGVNKILIK